jgi:hypothetical protein
MATQVETPQSPAQAQPQQAAETNLTTERIDYVVGYDIETDEKAGTQTKVASFYPLDTEAKIAIVEKKKADKSFEPSFQLTVQIPRAKNYAGCREICPDEEEGAANFNRGAKQKANNRLKAILTEVDTDNNLKFDPNGVDKETGKPNLVNGVMDMTDEIASPSQRKVLTEEEKLDRFLASFPESTRNMMKAAYLASRQAPAAIAG